GGGAGVGREARGRSRRGAAGGAVRRESGTPAGESYMAGRSAEPGARRVGRNFLERHARLHVLVNNAGALFAQRRESADGIEMTMALNHLGYFLFPNLLLDTLKASAPARVVNVSSRAHEDVKGLDLADIQASAGAHSFWG